MFIRSVAADLIFAGRFDFAALKILLSERFMSIRLKQVLTR
jgi:hypothetical protein